MTPISTTGGFKRTLRRPGVWVIAALLILITIPHYAEALGHPAFLADFYAFLGLKRASFERILYLAPIIWAGFFLGFRGAFFTSLASIALMLPRALFGSTAVSDALFEIGAVFVFGNAVALTFSLLARERAYRVKLEQVQKELQRSERQYRELFDSGRDAIWVTDAAGRMVAANKAAEILTCYSGDELLAMNIESLFLGDDCVDRLRSIRQSLIAGEGTAQAYELSLLKKDRSTAYVQVLSNVVYAPGEEVRFQHIARDVTEEKRMKENTLFYLQEATRAQEEERKRMSRELHDDTLQSLVVLSRQLDDLFPSRGTSADEMVRVDKLRQQIDSVIRGVRRLSQDLRPAALDRLGLVPSLEWLAQDVAQYSKMEVRVNVTGFQRRLPEEVALMVFRIVQEALRNVWKHSQATIAEVRVEFFDKKVAISVIDNGKGFSLPSTIGDLSRFGKLGLAGMQERARLINGTLTVNSVPNRGTTVRIDIPS